MAAWEDTQLFLKIIIMITGDEKVGLWQPVDGYGSSYHGVLPNGENAWCSSPEGITLKQLALKDFMCAIVQGMAAAGKTSLWTPQEVAYKSATLVSAYINELNKPSE